MWNVRTQLDTTPQPEWMRTESPSTDALGSHLGVPQELRTPPLVSVVVANFNYAGFVRTCLVSIAQQSYPNFECIVVDDASTDGSIEIIEGILAELGHDVSFQLVALDQNLGQMNAFHEGFARAKGAFVVFVDADDCLFEDFLATHVRAHLNRDCAAAMTCSDAVIIDGAGQIIAGLRRGRTSEVGERSRLSEDLPVECRLIPLWAETWSFDGGITIRERCRPLRYVSPLANFQKVWIWTSTSSAMFRRDALALVMTDRARGVRMSADFYLFQFCHLLGGTVLVPGAHGAYRRHGANNFAYGATISHRTISGGGSGTGEIWALIREEVRENGDVFRELLGRPRFMSLVSILYSPGQLREARRALGYTDSRSTFALVTRMLFWQLRIIPLRLRRAFG